MWSETVLKSCTERQLGLVFDDTVVILDLDTYNTPVGRPDVVLLNGRGQLIVVEFEPYLDRRNIEHALMDQAWLAARYWYSQSNQSSIVEMFDAYREYRFGDRPGIEHIRKELGLADGAVLWKPQQKCLVVAGAWHVDSDVYDRAARVIESRIHSDGTEMPCEFWIYDMPGAEDKGGQVRLLDCKRTIVYSHDGTGDHAEGPGFRMSGQHARATLTSEFEQVEQLLPRFMSPDMKGYSWSKPRWKNQLLKLSPWGIESGIAFEFSRMDSANKKGPNGIAGPHVQLCVTQNRELGVRLREHMEPDWPAIAKELGCSVSDLRCQKYAYPIKQHRIDDRTPRAIAEAFGRFCSVIYRRVDPIVRHVLGL